MTPGEGEGAVLLCDKPAGRTSHDVVAAVRRERPGVKVGHAGTLDPFATGLLLLLLGRATRLQRYLMPLPKTYRATARLGWRSSTGDPDGDLVETGRIPVDPRLPVGRIAQRVPMTSAVKVGGERLYRKAHRGEVVETPEREVEIYRAELIDLSQGRARFEVVCSAGTYVRTLVETLEDAYCEELRRVAIGPLRVEDEGAELRSGEALGFLPERPLDPDEARGVSHGRAIGVGETDAAVHGADPVRLTFDGRLLAVARREGERLRPEVVL
jgi:tRNA pseudouridine55 synthase